MIKKEWLFMQTPKEKATELIKMFSWLEQPNDSKKCAKIHVKIILENEILKPSYSQVLEYYQKVDEEIDKM